MASTKKLPSYRHHKGTGQAFVQVKGKRHYLGRYNTPESKEKYARFIAELASSPAPSASSANTTANDGATVVELAAWYLDFCMGYYRDRDGNPSGWLHHIRLALRGHLAELYGREPAASFGPKAFKAIRQRMIDQGLARSYINKLMPIITRCFKWGASEELIPPEVYHSLKTVEGLRRGRTAARETSPVRCVEDAAVDAALPYMPPVVADMVRFQRLTGCRPTEVCLVRPMDIDRGGHGGGHAWAYRPERHKTEHHGRQRIIQIGPRGQEVLSSYLLRPEASYCFSPRESEAKRREAVHEARQTPLSCGNRPGSNRKRRPRRAPRACYDKDSYARAVRRAIEKANAERTKAAKETGVDPELLPHWTPNQLRHTRATEIRRRFGLEAAQVTLGHAQANVTQVYAERDMKLAEEVMRKIG